VKAGQNPGYESLFIFIYICIMEYRSVVSIYLSSGLQITNYIIEESQEEVDSKKLETLEGLKTKYPSLELVLFTEGESIEHHTISELTNPQIEKKYFKL